MKSVPTGLNETDSDIKLCGSTAKNHALRLAKKPMLRTAGLIERKENDDGLEMCTMQEARRSDN